MYIEKPQLTIVQIRTLADHCLRNASKIIDESKLLFENRRYSRSFFLSWTAMEELSKRDMLFYAIFNGRDEARWNKFWREFRSHRPKIAKTLQHYYHLEVANFEDWFKQLGKSKQDAVDFNLAKQRALHVDILHGKSYIPSYSKGMAGSAIRIAEHQLKLHMEVKPTKEKLKISLEMKRDMKEGEHFIDWWMRTKLKH